jgi:hypothetical protein
MVASRGELQTGSLEIFLPVPLSVWLTWGTHLPPEARSGHLKLGIGPRVFPSQASQPIAQPLLKRWDELGNYKVITVK